MAARCKFEDPTIVFSQLGMQNLIGTHKEHCIHIPRLLLDGDKRPTYPHPGYADYRPQETKRRLKLSPHLSAPRR